MNFIYFLFINQIKITPAVAATIPAPALAKPAHTPVAPADYKAANTPPAATLPTPA